jgi:hypothetical protein
LALEIEYTKIPILVRFVIWKNINLSSVSEAIINSDVAALRELFESELPDQEEDLLKPLLEHVELMALSSNEIVQDIHLGKSIHIHHLFMLISIFELLLPFLCFRC